MTAERWKRIADIYEVVVASPLTGADNCSTRFVGAMMSYGAKSNHCSMREKMPEIFFRPIT